MLLIENCYKIDIMLKRLDNIKGFFSYLFGDLIGVKF